MNKHINQNLLYAMVFFVLTIISYFRVEYVAAVTSLVMSIIFAAIFFLLKNEPGEKTLTLKADN